MKRAILLMALPAMLGALLAWGQTPATESAPATDSAASADLSPASAPASAASPDASPAAASEPAATSTPVTGPVSATVPATGPAAGATSRPAIAATLPATGSATRPVVSPAERPAERPAAGPGVRPAPAVPLVKAPAWEDYQIITSRNIFSRDRGRRDVPRRIPDFGPRQEPISPLTYIVLTGVLLQGDLDLAFFENGRTGETTMVARGKPFADGTIVSVSLDQVEYRDSRGIHKIAVGQNLLGVTTPVYLAAALPASAPAAPSSQPTTGASTEPASQPAGTPPGLPAGGSLEERMRLRRLQETR